MFHSHAPTPTPFVIHPLPPLPPPHLPPTFPPLSSPTSLCVDQSTDINNCGTCSNFCDVSLDCCGGSCVNLNNSNNHCTHSLSRSSLCGDCTIDINCKRLPYLRHILLATTPTPLPLSHPSTTTSLCVDQSTDINNCGACGNFCDVSLDCCGGSCVNLNNSNDHCGACGARCPGQCTLGICDYGAAGGGAAAGGGGSGGGGSGGGTARR
ncbi:unnamed protein product [Closterium sp. Yama58-4]|nr:unnamed protein product [Closterium sp. Yama58-4]